MAYSRSADLYSNSERVEALYNIAAAHSQSGALDRAAEVFADAIRVAVWIENPLVRANAFEQIAVAQATSGFLEQALQTVERIDLSQYRSIALVGIAGSAAAKGDLNTAINLFDSAHHLSSGMAQEDIPLVLTMFDGAEAVAGLMDRAFVHFDEAVLNWTLWSDEPPSMLRMMFGIHLARAGDIVAAQQIAESIPTDERTSLYLQIAERQAKDGQFEAAIQTARVIPEARWRAVSYAVIAEQYAIAGDVVGADAGFDSAVTLALLEVEDDFEFAWTMSSIAKSAARADLIDVASFALRLVEEDFYLRAIAPEVQSLIAGALARAGNHSEALELAERIEQTKWSIAALINVAEALSN